MAQTGEKAARRALADLKAQHEQTKAQANDLLRVVGEYARDVERAERMLTEAKPGLSVSVLDDRRRASKLGDVLAMLAEIIRQRDEAKAHAKRAVAGSQENLLRAMRAERAQERPPRWLVRLHDQMAMRPTQAGAQEILDRVRRWVSDAKKLGLVGKPGTEVDLQDETKTVERVARFAEGVASNKSSSVVRAALAEYEGGADGFAADLRRLRGEEG